ncbi:MAG TPA: type II toxin-antitoxin system RatA family toxin [Rhizomicrobium sp.]|nr:type II toxin-antitoxin system RatA family toxin [Rhizomicrobium sp.]
MTTHRETRIVPYTADMMFGIVADVASYPKFLPWVTGTRILARDGDTMTAQMSVGFARFTESYTSRVVLDRQARTISVAQTDGPFRILANDWKFTPAGASGCRVDFAIQFEFRNPLLNMVAGAAFERVSKRMADAFEERARVLSRGA